MLHQVCSRESTPIGWRCQIDEWREAIPPALRSSLETEQPFIAAACLPNLTKIRTASSGATAPPEVGGTSYTCTAATSPYLDALTTIFSFFATYLEAKKILSAWIYWIIINGLTIGLYLTKGLDIYSTLSVIYFVMSFVGYVKWKKELV